MVWFKTDDAFHSHPKVLSIPRPVRAAAIGTWTLAGTWSANHLTDGVVPDYMIEELAGTTEGAEALVTARLWTRTRTGYRFKSWADYQPTKAEVEAGREAERNRKADYRKRLKGQPVPETPGPDGSPGSVPAGHQWDKGGIPDDPTRPDPTRPVTTEIPDGISPDRTADADRSGAREPGTEIVRRKPQAPTAAGGRYPADFEAFWALYPRHEGKRAAATAWERALRRTSASVITAAAARYRDDPNREAAFTAHAATWLNRDGWDDAPLPQRRPSSQQDRLEQSTRDTLAVLHQMGVAG